MHSLQIFTTTPLFVYFCDLMCFKSILYDTPGYLQLQGTKVEPQQKASRKYVEISEGRKINTLPETNIAGWKIRHFDSIYQEKLGFSWAMLVSGRVP